MDVDGFVGSSVGLLPDVGEELAFGDDAAGLAGEVPEEFEFFAAEFDGLAVEGDFAVGRVEGRLLCP